MQPLILALVSLQVGGGVGIHVEEAKNVSDHETALLADAVAKSVRQWTRDDSVVVEEQTGPECKKADRCVNEIRVRTRTDDVVLLRMYAVRSRVRLLAERFSRGGESWRVMIDVERKPDGWNEVLEPVAEALFPGSFEEPATALSFEVAPVQQPLPWPWIAVGAAATLGALSTAFGLSVVGIDNRLGNDYLTAGEIAEFERARNLQAPVAYALAVGAALTLGTAVVLWVTDSAD